MNNAILKLSTLSISLFLFCTINITLLAQEDYNKIIRKAVKNTYCKGDISYSIDYKSLGSIGDTSIETFTVTVLRQKDDFDYYSRFNDSFLQVSYKNILLRANTNSKTYWVTPIKPDDVFDELDYLYRPFLASDFIEYFTGDSVETILSLEDENIYQFKIYVPDEDLDEVYFELTIDKKINIITEFGVHVLVGGIPIWDNWKITSFKRLPRKDSVQMSEKLFFKILGDFKHYSNPKSLSNVQKINQEKYSLTDTLPFLNLISTKKDTIRMIDLHSKYYLVDFWFRSCFPCIKSAPIINELYSDYLPDQLHIFSINGVDKSNELIEKFAIDNGIKEPIYIRSREFDRFFQGIHTYPTFLLYDENFKLLTKIEGFSENLKSKIVGFIKLP